VILRAAVRTWQQSVGSLQEGTKLHWGIGLWIIIPGTDSFLATDEHRWKAVEQKKRKGSKEDSGQYTVSSCQKWFCPQMSTGLHG